jgi:hypothetical protein
MSHKDQRRVFVVFSTAAGKQKRTAAAGRGGLLDEHTQSACARA